LSRRRCCVPALIFGNVGVSWFVCFRFTRLRAGGGPRWLVDSRQEIDKRWHRTSEAVDHSLLGAVLQGPEPPEPRFAGPVGAVEARGVRGPLGQDPLELGCRHLALLLPSPRAPPTHASPTAQLRSQKANAPLRELDHQRVECLQGVRDAGPQIVHVYRPDLVCAAVVAERLVGDVQRVAHATT